MKQKQVHINMSSPNLINICVDCIEDGEISGRIFHCYGREPETFNNIIHLLNSMEGFFDSISFPQASTKPRYFVEPEKERGAKPQKELDQKDVIRHSGELATFVTCVKFRQNSAWQGELSWIERGETYRFSSTLEFIKLIDNALEGAPDSGTDVN